MPTDNFKSLTAAERVRARVLDSIKAQAPLANRSDSRADPQQSPLLDLDLPDRRPTSRTREASPGHAAKGPEKEGT